jgi:hypothetical protein
MGLSLGLGLGEAGQLLVGRSFVSVLASCSPCSVGETETKADNGLLPSPGDLGTGPAGVASGGPCYFLCWLQGSWPAWNDRKCGRAPPPHPLGWPSAGQSLHHSEGSAQCSCSVSTALGLRSLGLPCPALPRLQGDLAFCLC